MRQNQVAIEKAKGRTRRELSKEMKIGILMFLILLAMACFVFSGIKPSNVGFFLPRRLKKVAAIAITAYCIGYSSVTFQTITNNKILTPSVMGLDSLYLFVQTFIVFFFGSKQLSMMTGLSNFFLSIGVMIGASCLIFLLLFAKNGKNLYFLILAGMIMGGLFSGMSTFMQVMLDPNEFLVLQGKMFATFNNINEGLLGVSALISILLFFFTMKDYRKLDVVALGPDEAVNLGINYRGFVLKHLIVISILISVTTALTGPITFLGILVASLSREMIKTYHHTWRIAGAVLIGLFALILGQFLVERVFTFSTTISVIINFVGGIYFIYLLLKESKA